MVNISGFQTEGACLPLGGAILLQGGCEKRGKNAMCTMCKWNGYLMFGYVLEISQGKPGERGPDGVRGPFGPEVSQCKLTQPYWDLLHTTVFEMSYIYNCSGFSGGHWTTRTKWTARTQG